MRFEATGLEGAWVIEPEPVADARGMFARTFCERELAAKGIEFRVAQCNTSFNEKRDTLRGMHYQEGKDAEQRIVRCTAGAIYDVIVDLRPGSPTRHKWFGAELTAQNRRMLYVPIGFAHGFKTLEDGAEVFYLMSQFYAPEAARGVRWDDPRLAIRWPGGAPILSDRDSGYALLPA